MKLSKRSDSPPIRLKSLGMRRTEKYLKWWSRKRSKGQFHYVLRTSVWITLVFVLFVPLVEYLVNGSLPMEKLSLQVLFSVLAGVLISLVSWWGNEAKYKNARIDARIKINTT